MFKLTYRVKRDTLTPDLRRALRAAKNPQPALRAAGTIVVEMTKRAFSEAALRPDPWAPLKVSTLAEKRRAGKSNAVLKRDGVLWRSPRLITADSRRVIVGTDRFYARFHQLGTRKGIPARPFFPWHRNGKMTKLAQGRVRTVLIKKLGISK
jgi:phage gpG-like protein